MGVALLLDVFWHCQHDSGGWTPPWSALSISVYLCLSLSVSVYLCLSLSISVYLCLPLSMSVYLCLSLSMSVYVCLSLSMSVYVCLSLSISVYVIPWVHVPISLSGSRSVDREHGATHRNTTRAFPCPFKFFDVVVQSLIFWWICFFLVDYPMIVVSYSHQWPFQDPKLEVPTIYKAYFSGLNFREYPQKLWPKIWYSTSNLGSWRSPIDLITAGCSKIWDLLSHRASSDSLGFPSASLPQLQSCNNHHNLPIYQKLVV